MASKDWKKISSTKWQLKNKNVLYIDEDNMLSGLFTDKKYNLKYVIYHGKTMVIADFKTKSQILRIAKAYMKKH